MRNILQIGVNDAVDTLYEELSKIDHSKEDYNYVFIDASKEALDKAEKRYAEIGIAGSFRCRLVSADNDVTKKFYLPADELTSGHSSIYRFMVETDHPNGIVEREIPCVNINDLIKEFKSDIDLLRIDTEGMDADIVNAIDFDNLNIKIHTINFESAHSDGRFRRGVKYEKAVNNLLKNNYVVQIVELDSIATLKTIHESI